MTQASCSVPSWKKHYLYYVVNDKLRRNYSTLSIQFNDSHSSTPSRLGEYAYAYCQFWVMVWNLDNLFRFGTIKKILFHAVKTFQIKACI